MSYDQAMDESAAHEDDFDRVMAPAHQARWLVEPKWRDRDGQRPGDADWRQRDAPRFERLRAMKVWPEVEDVLRWYLHAGVPAARRSEWAYWSCVCLPDSEEVMTLAEVYVGAQKVCAAVVEDDLTFTFQFALSLADVTRFTQRPNVDVTELRPLPGKDVDVTVRAVGRDAAVSVLDDEVVVRALRRCNLELVRAGRCVASEQHNIVLADALLLEPGLASVPAPADEAYVDPPRYAAYRGPAEFDPTLPLGEALAHVDQMIDARYCEEALDALEKLHRRPGSAGAHGEIVERFERLVTLLKEEGAVRYALGAIVMHHSDLGDDERVLHWLPRAKVAFAGSSDFGMQALITAAAGRLHRRTGRPARGVELLARALAVFAAQEWPDRPTVAAFTMELGRCYTALGDHDAAMEHLIDAVDTVEALEHPLRLTTRCALAERHLKAGDFPSARQRLAQVLTLAKERGHREAMAPTLAALGWCDERLDATKLAVEHYVGALAALDDDAPVGLRRGVLAGLVRCHDRRGETAMADDYLARAEAMEGPAWPGEAGVWPLDELIELLLQLDPPAPNTPTEPDA